MDDKLLLREFLSRFPDNDACLEEIGKIKFRGGILCSHCHIVTKHYKIKGRTAYSCKICRHQVFPLSGTIFEKSSTPLQLWFYCMFLLTQTRGSISVKNMQQELGVTYKTAWRMSKKVKSLMELHDGDLLREPEEQASIHKWTFFNKFQFTVVQKQDASDIS